MKKGFSSNKIEEVFNTIIENNFNGEQLCELGNRISDYGKDLIYQKRVAEYNATAKHEL